MTEDAKLGVVRRFYQAVADKDFAAVKECFTYDATWHLPGKSVIAGDHRGVAAIMRDVLGKVGPLSGGTFKADLLDIAVGDEYVVAIQHATASHNGRRLDVTGCQLMTIRDGKIAEVRGHYSDQYMLDAFWG